jgi:hypothetical protein
MQQGSSDSDFGIPTSKAPMKLTLLFAVMSIASFAQTVSLRTESETKLNQATKAFNGCRNNRLRLKFSQSLTLLEATRKQLEVARKQTVQQRLKLENTRQKIEAEKFQTAALYLTRLNQEYTEPMRDVVRSAEATYFNGMNQYASAIENFGLFCQSKPSLETEANFFVESDATVKTLAENTQALVQKTAIAAQ